MSRLSPLLLLLYSLSTQASELQGKIVLPAGVAGEQLVIWSAEAGPPPKSGKIVIAQRGKEFVPRVVAVAAGTAVKFENLDGFAHNAFSLEPRDRFDLGMQLPAAAALSRRFKEPGRFHVFCNIHPDMHLIVDVIPHRAFTRLGADGSFRLPWKGAAPRELKAMVDGPGWPAAREITLRRGSGGYAANFSEAVRSEVPKHKRKDGTRYPEERKSSYQ